MPSTLQECTFNHLITLIRYHQSFNDKIINPFKQHIIQYLHEKQIDGETFLNIKRKQFSENLIEYIGNNKKIRGAGNKTWDRIVKYEFHTFHGIKSEKHTSSLPSSLQECTTNDLISIARNHESFDNETINPFKTTIIAYLQENEINGSLLSNIKRKQFITALAQFSKTNKISGAASQTHKRFLKHFQA